MTDECILSTRTPSQREPQIRRNGRTMPEVRYLWEQTHGPIPPGHFICHTCNTPRCINPAHHFLGTPRDNTLDMVRKGRSASQRKTHCPRNHEYTPENTYSSSGRQGRKCRACHLERLRRRDRRAAQ